MKSVQIQFCMMLYIDTNYYMYIILWRLRSHMQKGAELYNCEYIVIESR